MLTDSEAKEWLIKETQPLPTDGEVTPDPTPAPSTAPTDPTTPGEPILTPPPSTQNPPNPEEPKTTEQILVEIRSFMSLQTEPVQAYLIPNLSKSSVSFVKLVKLNLHSTNILFY